MCFDNYLASLESWSFGTIVSADNGVPAVVLLSVSFLLFEEVGVVTHN